MAFFSQNNITTIATVLVFVSKISGNGQTTTCFAREKGHCSGLGLRFLYDRPSNLF